MSIFTDKNVFYDVVSDQLFKINQGMFENYKKYITSVNEVFTFF